jgi:hypothetical protein
MRPAEREQLALGQASGDEQEDPEDERVLDDRCDRRGVAVRDVIGLLSTGEASRVVQRGEREGECEPRENAARRSLGLCRSGDHERHSSTAAAIVLRRPSAGVEGGRVTSSIRS